MKRILTVCLAILTVTACMPALPKAYKTYDSVVRFHIRANSDSEEDQNVKLLVRDKIVAYSESITKNCKNASEAAEVMVAHFGEMEQIAKEVLSENGFSYKAVASYTTEVFPEKTYGDVVFPEGIYNAIRLDLGKAEGQNFWCVLFPPICLANSCTENVLSEYGINDFPREDKVIVKFKLWEGIKSIFKKKEYKMLAK